MDGGAWQATVPGVTKSQTQLSDFTFFLLLTLSGVVFKYHLRQVSRQNHEVDTNTVQVAMEGGAGHQGSQTLNRLFRLIYGESGT